MAELLLRTPLCDWHAAHGGRMVPFGGWTMPVQYSSVVDEHTATRSAAGLFDISHMGRIFFRGPHAGRFLDELVTAEVATLETGRVRYALVTNESGGVLDDVLVYRLSPEDEAEYLVVVNAANRTKILNWVAARLAGSDAVAFEDRTEALGMIALQGPRSLALLQPLAAIALDTIPYYHAARATLAGTRALVSRTGYTGEDGVELIVPTGETRRVWEAVVAAGQSAGLKPCGLGARDTLRLEAGMPLYGHELDEQTNPLEAGLGFAVELGKPIFVGQPAIARAKQEGLRKRRVGLELEGKRIAREGYAVLHGGRNVGRVTSGTFGPTVGKCIAMAYVPPELARLDTRLAVDIRGQAAAARVVRLPFYKRPR